MNNVVKMPTPKFRDNSQKPIRFDTLHPGSLFRIVAEPSRGIEKSTDQRVYRKDLVGFFATEMTNDNHSAVLMPYDRVMPVVRLKPGQVAFTKKRQVS